MKDFSSRTRSIRATYFAAIGVISLMLISIMGITIGNMRYEYDVSQSSTAIGSQLKFGRSEASMTLKGLYTDTSHSALVARFGSTSSSLERLPAKGSDYRLFVSSPGLTDVKEMSMLFGRLSTDGDMFLVIPKPHPNAVYNVFIMNTKYIKLNDDKPSTLGETDIDATEKSITDILSKKRKSLINTEDAGAIKSDIADIVSLRLTLSPAINDEAHTAIELDTTLFENKRFNFESMFNKVFKETAFNQLSAEHAALIEEDALTKKSLVEFSDRLKENPADSVASQAYSKALLRLKDIDKAKVEISRQMAVYESLKFEESMFMDIQSKAKVINE